MKVTRRSDPKWTVDGSCPFYFFDDPSKPHCFITNCIVSGGDSNLFSSTDEALSLIDGDCGAQFDACPFIPALWDLTGRRTDEDLSDPIVVNDESPFVQIDFGWPFPQSESTSCDVLVIPTNTYLRFNDMLPMQFWQMPDDVVMRMMDECASMAKPMETGDVFSTSGCGSGYGSIVHCVISGLGGQSLDDVSDVVVAAMMECERMGAASVVIHPLCLLLGDNEGLAQTLFTQMSGLMKYLRSRTGRSISYVDITMPPTQEAHAIAMAVVDVVSG